MPVVIGGVTIAGVTSLLILLATGVTKPPTDDKDKPSNLQLPPNFQLREPADPTYTMLGNFSSGLAVVRKNGKSFYINKNLEIQEMKEAGFDGALDFSISDNLALVWIKGQNRGYIKKDGEFQIPLSDHYAKYMAGSFSEGLVHVCEANTCAYIDSQNRKVIETISDAGIKKTFTGAGRFSDDLAPVKTDGKWIYINKQGIVQIPQPFDEAYPFSEGLAPVKLGGQWMYINKYGTPTPTISKDFKEITYFSEGLAAVKNKDDKWGYIDNQGNTVIDPQFDDLKLPQKYSCDATDAEQERESRCMNLDDRHKFSNSPPLAAIYIKNGKWGYINRQGKTVIDQQFDTANPFSEKLASVCRKEKQVKKCGYIAYQDPSF